MGKWTDAAKQQRQVYDTAAAYLTDEEALTAKGAYHAWEELVETGETVAQGYRFQHGGKLYKTAQPSYTFVQTYVPGTTGTESLFVVIDETHAGTLADPIPYDGNMELVEGKYYTQDGVVYLCTRSTGSAVYHALADLVGIYVEVVENQELEAH